MNLDELHRLLKLAVERRVFHASLFFTPVPKQEAFFTLGATKSERMLMAGNGNGKTEAAAYEVTCHMTGDYPDWWPGYRFNRPVRVWACGTDFGQGIREAGQTKLCGPPGDTEAFGSGMIPRELFVGKPVSSRSAADAFDSFQVQHKSGGTSRLVFKAYQQDRRHWQGADVDLIWFDEEPPMELYTEGQARLRGRGISMMTFTPLFGMSDVVCRFLEQESDNRGYVKMGINDALWYTPEQRQRMIDSYPAHEREARANGDPLLGSGKVFTAPDEMLREPASLFNRIPKHWLKLWGVDFGIDHPFAASLCAWDRDLDSFHVLHTIRMSNAIPLQHADAMMRIAATVPVAWPHDGHNREKGSGETLAAIYKGHGLNMMLTHATHPDGGYSVYGGITEMDTYMKGGRWKVSATDVEWFQEYGQYHYKNGQIVKIRDDLLDSSRIAFMMRRFGRPVDIAGGRAPGARPGRVAARNYATEAFRYF